MIFAMGSLVHRLRTNLLTWHLKNLPRRLRYQSGAAPLNPAESEVCRHLKQDGIAVVHISKLYPEAVFRELLSDVDGRMNLPEPSRRLVASRRGEFDETEKRKVSFLVDLWGPRHEIDPANPFIRLSLSKPMLSIVNSYLGTFARFREFFLQVTVPVGQHTSPFASQRWHADPDDYRLVKVFLYLNDVDERAGPFTYIKGTHGTGRWRHIFPYAPKKKSRHPDPDFIERTIPKEDIFTAIGKAGTMIFCDTSGIHRGGYATGRERVMYTSVYTTQGGFLPTRLEVPATLNIDAFDTRSARAALRTRP